MAVVIIKAQDKADPKELLFEIIAEVVKSRK